MLSITDKEIKSEKWFFCVPVWILLKYQPDHQLGPVITTFYQKSPCFQGLCLKKGECYWATAESMLNVDSFRKMLFSAWWICESTNQKTLWWSNSSSIILFQDSITSKHAMSPQLLSVSHVAMPLSCFFS